MNLWASPRLYLTILVMSLYGGLMAQTSIMTYNIRYNNPNDGPDWWENRKAEVAVLIQHYAPGILGTQEGLKEQLDYLTSALPHYQYIGQARDDGKEQGEFSAILYDTTQYQLISEATYWLSPTPRKISQGWDAALKRVVTLGVFRHQVNGDTLHVFNAHYDHRGEQARINSSKVILDLIKQHNLSTEKVVVMGDFNSLPQQEPIQVLLGALSDCYLSTTSPPYGPEGTFNGFDPLAVPDRRIDYIFVMNLEVTAYRVIDDRRRNQRWPSDHLPVLVKI